MSLAAPLRSPRPGPVRVDDSPFAPSVAPAARPASPAPARELWRARSQTLPEQVSLLSLVARTATPTPRQQRPQIATIPLRDGALPPPGPTPAELLALWRSIQPVTNALAVLAALVLFVALALAIVPQAFGMETLVVSGGSMGSSIGNGSIVVARWIDAEDVEPGDVIVARRPSEAGESSRVVHRVVAVERIDGETVIRTKGDANSAEDPGSYVLPPRVPTPLYIIPYLGYAVALVGTPLGWTLLIGVPGLVLCILTLHSIWATESNPTTGPRRSARHEAAAA